MKRFVAIALLLFGSFSLFAQQWEISIELNGINGYLNSGCCNKNNETIFVGGFGSEAYIVKVNEDGGYEEKFFQEESRTLRFRTIDVLENGNYFVSGVSTAQNEDLLWILNLDENFDIVTEHFYEKEEGYPDNFFSDVKSMVDDDGTIVVTLNFRPEIGASRGMLFRFSADGDCLQRLFISHDVFDGLFGSNTSYRPNCIINDPYSSDFIILGSGQGGNASVLRCSYDFTLVEHHIIAYPLHDDIILPDHFYSDHWLSNDTLLLFGTLCPYDANEPYVYFGKINNQGVICEVTDIDKPDTLNYTMTNHAMCTANDSTIYLIPYAVLGDWMGPKVLEVYVANTDLEILGYKSFYDEKQYWPDTAIATNDDGLVTISTKGATAIHIKKFLREDLNPIPCSVKDVPKEQIKATVSPNPAGDEIHFDFSELPAGKEHRISISDAMGRLVMSRIIRGEGNVLTIGISGFKPGIYTYQIYNAEKEIVGGKFVKE